MRDVVILSAARTPIGSFSGSLASIPAPRLGAVTIGEALRRAKVEPGRVDEVLMGNVVSAGLGQAPARQAAIYAGVPEHVGATTVNKVCGSGLKAILLGAQAIQVGAADCIVAGGMESMSGAPYLLPKARTGYRMGHAELVDSMILDGLWDVYSNLSMGACGEMCAAKFGLTREEQDAYAAQSYSRTWAAQKAGKFKAEIVPVAVAGKGGTTLVEEDEDPKRGNLEKLPKLKPAFKPDGTITAGNAPSVNDGAAALVLMAADRAAALGLTPLARIGAAGHYATAPEWFTVTPGHAILDALKKAGLKPADVDLYEVNEAFAAVALAAIQVAGLDPVRVNVHGGAVALGHPIGATGARLVVTLLHALQDRGGRRGIAALCLGGGEGMALVIERV
ncbi:MAG: acetyl-CoA C-acyltransferase [candidate division NC10 bacterium]|nr:acetyl-CoA C-acyltransferase [candidate division NC10 bacterium]